MKKEILSYPLNQKVYKEALKNSTKQYETWSKKDLNYLRKNYKGMSAQELASALGRSVYAIRSQVQALKKKGLNPIKSKTPNWTPEEEKFLLDNFSKLKVKEIAKSLKRSEVAIKIRYGLLQKKASKANKNITATKEVVKSSKSAYKTSKLEGVLTFFTIINTIILSYILITSIIH